jgi:acyl-CoA thioesterase FadM
MNLYFRLLGLLLRCLARKRRASLEPSRLKMRVWPNDLDVFGHMNNGRYLTLMDLGRFDIVFSSGLLGVMRRRRWYAVVATAEVRFFRPLKCWQRYTLVTEIIDWDAHRFVFEQRFESEGKLALKAMLVAQFRRGREPVPTEEVFASVGLEPPTRRHEGGLAARIAPNVASKDQ